MYFKDYFIHKNEDSYLVIGAHDEDELARASEMWPQSNVAVEFDAINSLQYFSSIEKLVILPGDFRGQDLSFLQRHPVKYLKLDYYSDTIDEFSLDLLAFPYLELLFSRSSRNFSGISNCGRLKALIVQEWWEDDFCPLAGTELSALGVFSGKLKSLHGVELLPNLRSLSISYQRRLADCNALSSCKQIEKLKIAKCPKIDFMRLPELPHLSYLSLSSNQSVENLCFIRKFPDLKYCILDIKINDGNLEDLKSVLHCAILKECKNYNMTNSDLPKNTELVRSIILKDPYEVIS